ncbi:hypothetical protein A2U01_0033023, partial [Trifolium medium]|nr:hypothetical protein [Trifolium medium]
MTRRHVIVSYLHSPPTSRESQQAHAIEELLQASAKQHKHIKFRSKIKSGYWDGLEVIFERKWKVGEGLNGFRKFKN